MGKITGELVVSDQFSESFSRFIDLGNSSVQQMGRINQAAVEAEMTIRRSFSGAAVAMVGDIGQSSSGAVMELSRITDSFQRMGGNSQLMAVQSMSEMNVSIKGVVDNTAKAEEKQEKHNKKIKQAEEFGNKLMSTMKKIGSLGVSAGKGLFGLSDKMSLSNTKINSMNKSFQPVGNSSVQGEGVASNGLEETSRIQELIYQSAQRTRMSYLGTVDAVTALAKGAGDAFSSSDEVVAFAENMNKQLKSTGASQQESASASEQLTKALRSGVLTSEQFNAVAKTAPNIIQTIADYMGMPVTEVRSLAAEGKITADIVKNAMLGATDNINEEFKNVPMTWSDAWALIQNAATYSLSGVSDKINEFLNSDIAQKALGGIVGAIDIMADVAEGAVGLLTAGAGFIADNWSYVYPVLIGIGAAFAAAGVIGMISGLGAAVAWLSVVWPFILIGALVAILILALTNAGVTFEQIGEVAGAAFGFIYAVGYNLVADLWNLIAVFAEFFANVFNDPVAAIDRLMFGLFDTILGVVETAANAIDAICKTNISGAVSGFRSMLSELTDDVYGEQAVTIKRMTKLDTGKTADSASEYAKGVGNKMDNMNISQDNPLSKITDSLGGNKDGYESVADNIKNIESMGNTGNVENVDKVGSVEKINQDVNIADENIKLLRDLSERQYVALVNLTVPQTNATINQTVHGGGGSDVDSMVGALNNILGVQQSVSSNVLVT
jgi:tape measure domain-containing protein